MSIDKKRSSTENALKPCDSSSLSCKNNTENSSPDVLIIYLNGFFTESPNIIKQEKLSRSESCI